MNFKDKVVLVTGAGSGIGQATAIAFSEQGATVIVTGRNSKKCEETVNKIRAQKGVADFFKVDISQENEVKSMIENANLLHGRIDIAVNNAGIEGDVAPLHLLTSEQFKSIMDINLQGTFLCLKYELSQMLQNPSGGVIINVSSILGMRGLPCNSLYAASKAGINALTKCVAMEYAQQKIRINSICAGLTKTALLNRSFEKNIILNPSIPDLLMNMVPMHRVAEPEEIANSILFLASDQSSYITGQCVAVDGGIMA